MQELQTKLRAARLKRKVGRLQIADDASEIAGMTWPDEPLDINEKHVRSLDTRTVTPPANGRMLRCVLAASDIPLTDALEAIGYWPDLRIEKGPKTLAARLVEAARMVGFPGARLVSSDGTRVTIDLSAKR